MTRTYWTRADWLRAYRAHPGLSAADFARVTGKSVNAVYQASATYGLTFTYSAMGTAAALPKGHGATRPSVPQSGRMWTDEEIDYLLAMQREGLSGSEMGKRLGRSRNSVLGKLHRLVPPARLSPQTRAA